MSIPPMTTAQRIPIDEPSASNCSEIWNASSRVGARTQAKSPFGSSHSFCKMGSAKAAVFPEPVDAIPMISRPSRAWGRASDWMSVGFLKPIRSRASNRGSIRPNDLKVVGSSANTAFELLASSGPDIVGGGAPTKDLNLKLFHFRTVSHAQVQIITLNESAVVCTTTKRLTMVLPPDPASQSVIITYAAPPTFLASPNWNKVYSTILSLLPLRNLHWKPTSRPSIRTIQELNASLVPFENFPDEIASQFPGTLLEKPLLHLFILHCEVRCFLS